MNTNPQSSAFNDLYLAPLARAERKAAAIYGVGTPEFDKAMKQARHDYGLRLDGEIQRGIENNG